MNTYHDLTLFWQSPRAWAFKKMGYRPRPKPGPMTTGILTHKAIEMWWKGEKDIAKVMDGILKSFGMEGEMALTNTLAHHTEIKKNAAQALEWATRYVEMFGDKYKPILIEGELVLNDVMIHPDLTAVSPVAFPEYKVVIDYKTTADAYIPAYHQSMQLDLYAYVLSQLMSPVDEIAYHVISDKIYESARPPDKRIGEYIYKEVRHLGVIDLGWAMEQERPYYQAGRTGYWEAEMQYREDGLQAAVDYMEEHMEKEA